MCYFYNREADCKGQGPQHADVKGRMSKLDRVLELVHALANSNEGLTLDDMANELGVNRRTAERLRDLVSLHFDLDEYTEDRRKYFRIRGSLTRTFTRPNAAEIAALQAEVDARKREGSSQAHLLESLLKKLKSGLDIREKIRLAPDLDPLTRLQGTLFQPGPLVDPAAQVLQVAQQAIMAGRYLEFEYQSVDATKAKCRRVVPYGLIHGPVTYLLGSISGNDLNPAVFRLDRIKAPRLADQAGVPADGWEISNWMDQSAGIWREEEHEIVLRVLPDAVERALKWRFHPRQIIEEDGDCLIVRFRSGGLWQIADHVFTWRGSIVIEEPDDLLIEMRERLNLFAYQLNKGAES